MIASQTRLRYALRAAFGLVTAGLVLSACTHAEKKAAKSADERPHAQKSRAGGQSPDHQHYPQRVLASEEESPIEVMKKWVVTPHEKLGFIATFDEIHQNNLFSGEATDKPWSGSYWPDRLGGVASHYRQITGGIHVHRNVERTYKAWKRRHEKTLKNFDILTEQEIAILSPAEKYDLLMGDREFTFTNKVWEGIRLQARLYGTLAGWSGICNGWTASSIALNRPRRLVPAMSPHGKIINFYPDDLKALASVLWAHDFVGFQDVAAKEDPSQPPKYSKMWDGTPGGVMYGLRCNKKRPKRENGVVKELDPEKAYRSTSECRDMNPAVWHFAIVNRTGAQKQSFVMDKDYDGNVNNHAAYGYRYTYFNVKTGKPAVYYREALVDLKSVQNDPFAAYRSPRTKYLLGIDMKVKYIDYLKGQILGDTWDDENKDLQDVMDVKYDLELDAHHRPISGQWRVNRKQKPRFILGYQKPSYPDFIWYQRQWTYSVFEDMNDPYLDKHDWSTQPVPEILRERAKQSAAVTWAYTVAERAGMSVVPDGPIRAAARKASNEYDEVCLRLCDIAYPKDANGFQLPDTSPAWNSPAAIAARMEMEPFDKALTAAAEELDRVGAPRVKPYVQPVARVVYGLFEAAKERAVNPPPRPETVIDNSY